MTTLSNEIENLLKEKILTKQDVLEMTERIIQIYLNQQEDFHKNDEEISVESDSEGDYIDNKGNIYDIQTKNLIGKKNMQTKKKQMFNVV